MLPEHKNKVLKYLVDNHPSFDFNLINASTEANKAEVSKDFFNECVEYFGRRNFLEYKSAKQDYISIKLKLEAHDFIRHGGFIAEEEMLKLQFIKLDKEIRSLESQISKDKFDIISSIMNTIAAYYANFVLSK